MYPFLKKLFADGGYQGPDFQKALAKILPQLETEIVKRSDRTKGFVVLPRRWVVERTFAWLNRCRRLAKDWENLNRNALVSTPEQNCIGLPEQKYISDAGKKGPRTGGLFLRHHAWLGLSAGMSELARRELRLL